ncbi:hypothetical protein LJC30_06680 [Odoribacter sp. OttesenSCG-928-L07]|nr:hypothetical protein [Odoribacter sp. OttesenSCG-928-L07]MDL2240989.1 hypothetical protein [Bacteroidales bacterium OttesenSCG-928-K22]
MSDDKMNIPYLSISYSYQFPLADMAKSFGSNSTIGAGFTYKTQNNFLWGIDWEFLFSGNVKLEETLFQAITTNHGIIINGAGQPAVMAISERGNIFSLRFGKVFDVFAHNPNSGLFATGSVGVLTHKIRIDITQNDVPQLDPDYRKGYDRSSLGPTVGAQFGYIYFDNNRLINFKAEIEAHYGLTRSIRPYNFDTMAPDHSWKHDFLIGLKISWIIPLYPKAPRDFYYD